MNRQHYTAKLTICLTAAALALLSANRAQASGPINEDVFNRNTNSLPNMFAPSPNKLPSLKAPALSPQEVAKQYFNDLDKKIVADSPNIEDSIKLNQPFAHDFKKVAIWSNTAAALAHKYRHLAQLLRSMPTPTVIETNCPANFSLTSYKSHLADWYDDSAAWLEDYLRPRVAAATQEELKEALAQMTERATQLKQQHGQLEMMDNQLREHFQVRRFQDKLWDYVSRKPQN